MTLTCNMDSTLIGYFEGDAQNDRTLELEYAAGGSTTEGVKITGEVVVTGVRPTANANGETELVITLRPAGPLTISSDIS